MAVIQADLRWPVSPAKNWRICWCKLLLPTRDVKTVYFSEPVTGLPKPAFYRLPKGLLCHRSLGACYQSIACCFTAAVAAFQTHGRLRRETKDSGVSKR